MYMEDTHKYLIFLGHIFITDLSLLPNSGLL